RRNSTAVHSPVIAIALAMAWTLHATLNHARTTMGIPRESAATAVGINHRVGRKIIMKRRAANRLIASAKARGTVVVPDCSPDRRREHLRQNGER
ncbi:MAG: hypothetical protein ACK50Q_12825, partial [Labrys sp. (in: a-proteobacteria)]